MTADETLVRSWLRAAIEDAYEGERLLFQERAHERSIVFSHRPAPGDRVAAWSRDAGSAGWLVDVEYDRWHPGDVEWLKGRPTGRGGTKYAWSEAASTAGRVAFAGGEGAAGQGRAVLTPIAARPPSSVLPGVDTPER